LNRFTDFRTENGSSHGHNLPLTVVFVVRWFDRNADMCGGSSLQPSILESSDAKVCEPWIRAHLGIASHFRDVVVLSSCSYFENLYRSVKLRDRGADVGSGVAGPRALQASPSTGMVNPQPYTLNPQPCTRNPECYTLHPTP